MARIGPRILGRIAALEAAQNAREVKVGGPIVADLIDEKFPNQKAFLEDERQLVALLCTRRAAKSFSAGKRLVRAMFKHPGCSVLFIGLTKESAKKILWKDVLKVINRRWNLEARFNDSELTMTMPNGSVLYLTGADASEDEMEKMLGQKYAEVVIDEAASYTIDLRRLVYGVLKPAVADYRGTICIVGTPSNIKKGLFFDLTKDQDPSKPGRWGLSGFSCHRWSTFQNPYMADNWRAEIAQLIEDNPRIEETPLFKQHYLGLWTVDDSKLVYKYQPGRNDFTELPVYERGEWHFGLAIDLGFTDAASFTISAYHDHDKCLYFPLSYKKPGLDITATAEEAQHLLARFPVEHVIIDGSAKQAVEELNNRHNLGAVPAEKTEKFEHIDIMNGEFIQERIKLGPDAQALKDEYEGLVVDERKLLKGKRVEHPSCQNHCADGALYRWRHTWQYLSAPIKKKHAMHSAEARAEQQAVEQQKLDEQFEKEFQTNAEQQAEARENAEWM